MNLDADGSGVYPRWVSVRESTSIGAYPVFLMDESNQGPLTAYTGVWKRGCGACGWRMRHLINDYEQPVSQGVLPC